MILQLLTLTQVLQEECGSVMWRESNWADTLAKQAARMHPADMQEQVRQAAVKASSLRVARARLVRTRGSRSVNML
eukprot:541731-Amphidinium_carterae.2